MGMIQASDAVSSLADVVLGVPFMRSVYTVMAYDPPDSKGNFPNISTGISPVWRHCIVVLFSRLHPLPQAIRPRLGFLGLIDPTVALDEFHQERVLNQALPAPSGSSGSSSSGTNGGRANVAVAGGKKLSVGVEVLIGLAGFAGLLIACFAAWWLVHRKRRAQEQRVARAQSLYGPVGEGDEKDRAELMQREAAYILARRSTISSRYSAPEDTLRAKKFQEYMDRQSRSSRIATEYSDDTLQTHVDVPLEKDIALAHDDDDHRRYSELGVLRSSRLRHSTYSPDEADDAQDATLVDRAPVYPPTHSRTQTMQHEREVDAALAVPLLAHTRTDSQGSTRSTYPPERAAHGAGRPASHARVGSIAENSVGDPDAPRPLSAGSARRSQPRSLSGPRPMSRRSSAGSVSSVSSRRSTVPLPPPPLPSTLAPGNDAAPSGSSSANPSVGHGS